MNIKFETKISELKHKVLVKVATLAYQDRLLEGYSYILKKLNQDQLQQCDVVIIKNKQFYEKE